MDQSIEGSVIKLVAILYTVYSRWLCESEWLPNGWADGAAVSCITVRVVVNGLHLDKKNIFYYTGLHQGQESCPPVNMNKWAVTWIKIFVSCHLRHVTPPHLTGDPWTLCVWAHLWFLYLHIHCHTTGFLADIPAPPFHTTDISPAPPPHHWHHSSSPTHTTDIIPAPLPTPLTSFQLPYPHHWHQSSSPTHTTGIIPASPPTPMRSFQLPLHTTGIIPAPQPTPLASFHTVRN